MKTEKKIPERSRSVLGRFYCIKISFKNQNKIFTVLLLIKCSLYDFYNIICISSMFTWPYIQYGYSFVDVASELGWCHLVMLTRHVRGWRKCSSKHVTHMSRWPATEINLTCGLLAWIWFLAQITVYFLWQGDAVSDWCRRLRFPEFVDSRHMKVTALRNDHLYPYS